MNNYLRKLSRDLRIINMGDYFNLFLQTKKVSSRNIAKKINIPYRSFRNYMNNSRAMPLEIALKIIKTLSKNKTEELKLLDKLYEKITWLKSTSSNSQKVRIPKEFSKELAYLIGAIHDGTVFANKNKKQYLIQYWQFSDKNWLKIISKKLERVFGLKPKRYKNYLQLSNKVVYDFFAKVIDIKQHQYKWDSFLKEIPKELQLHAIAGMFDAEGWIGNINDLRLKFSQKNKLKLIEVKNTLKKHNIESGNVISENDSFALWLCGKNCIKFSTKVGCFCEHIKKRQKINNIHSIFG